MKISKSKSNLAAISLLLLAVIALPLLSLPSAIAHDPPWTINSYSYITASPNPIGPNQDIVLVFWQAQPPPSAMAKTGDRWEGLTLDIKKPDGTVDHAGPFISDPVGSAYYVYRPQATGTYTVTYNFPQQVCDRIGTTGIAGSNSQYVNDTFKASSATTTFTVQPTSIQYFQEAPIPLSYWTRPIDSNNQNWWPIGGSWLGQNEFGATYLKYGANAGRGPNTAHVMWTKPISWGGIVGATEAALNDITFYSGTAYQLKFANPIIMYGTLFFSLPLANNPSGLGVTAVDLRTGQTLWTRDDVNSVSFGQLLDFESPNQHGVNPNGYLWRTATLPAGVSVSQPSAASVNMLKGNYAYHTSVGAAASGGSATPNVTSSIWAAIDPFTGANVFNETNVPSGTRAQGPQGEWLIYNIGRASSSQPYTYLYQWNNTKYPGQDSPTAITAWGATNANYNMSCAYDFNVTLSQPLSGNTDPLYGNSNPSMVRIFPGNLIFGQSSSLQQTSSTSSNIFGSPNKFELWAINLNETRGPVGQVLFDRKYDAPQGNLTVLIGPEDGETNMFTLYYRETMQWVGYDMLTGNQVWGPTASENAWNFYGGTTGLTAPYAIGYGNLYSGGYSGTIYAYDLKTGKLEFTYGNNAADPKNCTITANTVYGDYPEQIAGVVDGKIYMVPCEHSLDSPPYHGASVRAIDAFTGEQKFTLYGMSSWQMQAIADGYWTFLNLNDMQVYSVGAGPSATTIDVKSDVVSLGKSVLVTGTVTDQSPALKGTAAIADTDQGPWMEYMIQHNRVKPTAQGVPVTLTAVDGNGASTEIGKVWSDSNGVYHKLWTPPTMGEYTIVATFDGSLSYGPSSAATAIGVTAAESPQVITVTATPSATATVPPSETATATATATTSASPSIPEGPSSIPASTVYAIAAAAVVIVVVAVAAVALRRRK